MLLSSRQTPSRLSLHRAGSHNSLASARALLTSSPLPSPGLPSILPRHGKKPPKLNRRKISRLLLWLLACALFFWFAARIARSDQSLATIAYLSPENQAHRVVGDGLPREPSPIIVTDQRGRLKWTISIPSTLDFPLKPVQYANICEQSMEMSQHVAMLKKTQSDRKPTHAAHHGYYYTDPHFMDISDAESHNLLSGISSVKSTPQSEGSLSDESPMRQCIALSPMC